MAENGICKVSQDPNTYPDKVRGLLVIRCIYIMRVRKMVNMQVNNYLEFE